MANGIMQLVAQGAQDVYLTGNPQITFFKVVYRRHTNFAIETVEKHFTGTLGFGNSLSSKITRDGDLVTKIYLRIILNQINPGIANFAWTRRIGFAIINQVNVTIGGTVIDRNYGTWLDIWYELARAGFHDRAVANMIGDVPELTTYNSDIKPEYTLYVPMQFWFNRFVGLAIPLIALQYHDTYLNLEFEQANKLIIYSPGFDINLVSINNLSMLVNYVYLDTEERRRFAMVGHEYLIEQLQFNGTMPANNPDVVYTLDYNHPVKELFFAVKNGNYISGKSFIYYSGSNVWSVVDACCTVVYTSIEFNDPTGITGGTWVAVAAGQIITVGTFNMRNNNANTIYVNPTSLSIGDYGITDKIYVDIVVDSDGTIECDNVVTTLTIRDFSIPLEYMTDTRYTKNDPHVNIFSNYGLLIDGTNNPINTGLLQFNGHDRFDRRENAFFNYVIPYQCHNNTPRDGINVYSFALFPEQHQPSGTANFSRIDSSTLNLSYSDSTQTTSTQTNSLTPSLHWFDNGLNQTYIYATNYNILRVYSGLSGLAYAS